MDGRPRLEAAPRGARSAGTWRQLLAEVSAGVAAGGAPGREEEVLFDTVLEGVRYALVRRPAGEAGQAEPRSHAGLSAREHEIARMVAKGYTNKTIAAVLRISSWTVDTHLRRIYRKLGVSSRSAMVTRLTRDGALDERDVPDWSEAWQARVAAGGRGAGVT